MSKNDIELGLFSFLKQVYNNQSELTIGFLEEHYSYLRMVLFNFVFKYYNEHNEDRLNLISWKSLILFLKS